MAALSTRHRPVHKVGAHDDLVDLMVRMTEEYPELPAGSVMRCVARAVLRARMTGTPHEHVGVEAERTARLVLAERLVAPVPVRVRRAG
jgi:hypothetical protein